MASTTSRPTRSMSLKGGTPARVKISHMASTSSGGATPSSTTIRHSRLIAVQITEDLGLEVDPLGNCLDHHPAASEGFLQVIEDFDTPAPGGVQPERLLRLGDVLFDVIAGCLTLLRREVEDAYVAAARRVHRGDPASECPRAVDDHRTLVYISRKRVGHDVAPPCRVARFKIFEY